MACMAAMATARAAQREAAAETSARADWLVSNTQGGQPAGNSSSRSSNSIFIGSISSSSNSRNSSSLGSIGLLSLPASMEKQQNASTCAVTSSSSHSDKVSVAGTAGGLSNNGIAFTSGWGGNERVERLSARSSSISGSCGDSINRGKMGKSASSSGSRAGMGRVLALGCESSSVSSNGSGSGSNGSGSGSNGIIASCVDHEGHNSGLLSGSAGITDSSIAGSSFTPMHAAERGAASARLGVSPPRTAGRGLTRMGSFKSMLAPLMVTDPVIVTDPEKKAVPLTAGSHHVKHSGNSSQQGQQQLQRHQSVDAAAAAAAVVQPALRVRADALLPRSGSVNDTMGDSRGRGTLSHAAHRQLTRQALSWKQPKEPSINCTLPDRGAVSARPSLTSSLSTPLSHSRSDPSDSSSQVTLNAPERVPHRFTRVHPVPTSNSLDLPSSSHGQAHVQAVQPPSQCHGGEHQAQGQQAQGQQQDGGMLAAVRLSTPGLRQRSLKKAWTQSDASALVAGGGGGRGGGGGSQKHHPLMSALHGSLKERGGRWHEAQGRRQVQVGAASQVRFQTKQQQQQQAGGSAVSFLRDALVAPSTPLHARPTSPALPLTSLQAQLVSEHLDMSSASDTARAPVFQSLAGRQQAQYQQWRAAQLQQLQHQQQSFFPVQQPQLQTQPQFQAVLQSQPPALSQSHPMQRLLAGATRSLHKSNSMQCNTLSALQAQQGGVTPKAGAVPRSASTSASPVSSYHPQMTFEVEDSLGQGAVPQQWQSNQHQAHSPLSSQQQQQQQQQQQNQLSPSPYLPPPRSPLIPSGSSENGRPRTPTPLSMLIPSHPVPRSSSHDRPNPSLSLIPIRSHSISSADDGRPKTPTHRPSSLSLQPLTIPSPLPAGANPDMVQTPSFMSPSVQSSTSSPATSSSSPSHPSVAPVLARPHTPSPSHLSRLMLKSTSFSSTQHSPSSLRHLIRVPSTPDFHTPYSTPSKHPLQSQPLGSPSFSLLAVSPSSPFSAPFKEEGRPHTPVQSHLLPSQSAPPSAISSPLASQPLVTPPRDMARPRTPLQARLLPSPLSAPSPPSNPTVPEASLMLPPRPQEDRPRTPSQAHLLPLEPTGGMPAAKPESYGDSPAAAMSTMPAGTAPSTPSSSLLLPAPASADGRPQTPRQSRMLPSQPAAKAAVVPAPSPTSGDGRPRTPTQAHAPQSHSPAPLRSSSPSPPQMLILGGSREPRPRTPPHLSLFPHSHSVPAPAPSPPPPHPATATASCSQFIPLPATDVCRPRTPTQSHLLPSQPAAGELTTPLSTSPPTQPPSFPSLPAASSTDIGRPHTPRNGRQPAPASLAAMHAAFPHSLSLPGAHLPLHTLAQADIGVADAPAPSRPYLTPSPPKGNGRPRTPTYQLSTSPSLSPAPAASSSPPFPSSASTGSRRLTKMGSFKLLLSALNVGAEADTHSNHHQQQMQQQPLQQDVLMILGDRDSSSDVSAADPPHVEGQDLKATTAFSLPSNPAVSCTRQAATLGIDNARNGAYPPFTAHSDSAPIALQAQQQQFAPPARSSSGTITLDAVTRAKRVLPRTGSVSSVTSTSESRMTAGWLMAAGAAGHAAAGAAVAAGHAAGAVGAAGVGTTIGGGAMQQGVQPHGERQGNKAGSTTVGRMGVVPSAAWGAGSSMAPMRYGSGLQLQRSISANPHNEASQPVALRPTHLASHVRNLHRCFSEAPGRHLPLLQSGHEAVRHSVADTVGNSNQTVGSGGDIVPQGGMWQDPTAWIAHGGNRVLGRQVAVIGPSVLNLRPLVVPLCASQSGDEQTGRPTFMTADAAAAAAALPLSCRVGVGGGDGGARPGTPVVSPTKHQRRQWGMSEHQVVGRRQSTHAVTQQQLQTQASLQQQQQLQTQASLQQQQSWQGQEQVPGQWQESNQQQQQQQHHHQQQQQQAHNSSSTTTNMTSMPAVQPSRDQTQPHQQQRWTGRQMHRQMSAGNQQMSGMMPGTQVSALGQSTGQVKAESWQVIHHQQSQQQQHHSLRFDGLRPHTASSPATAHTLRQQALHSGSSVTNPHPLGQPASKKLQRSVSRPELLQQLAAEVRQKKIIARSASMSARRAVTTTVADNWQAAIGHEGSSQVSVASGNGNAMLMSTSSKTSVGQSMISAGRSMQAGEGSSSVRRGGTGGHNSSTTISQGTKAVRVSGGSGSAIGSGSCQSSNGSGSSSSTNSTVLTAVSTSPATSASSRNGQSNESSPEFHEGRRHSFSTAQAVRMDTLQAPAAATSGVPSPAQGVSGGKVRAVGGTGVPTGSGSSRVGHASSHRQGTGRSPKVQSGSQSPADSLAVRVGRRTAREISKFPSDSKLSSPKDATADRDRSHSCPSKKNFLPARRHVPTQPSPVHIPAYHLPLGQPQTPSPGPHLASRLRNCSTSRPGVEDVTIVGGVVTGEPRQTGSGNQKAAEQGARGSGEVAQPGFRTAVSGMSAKLTHRSTSHHERTMSDGFGLLQRRKAVPLSPVLSAQQQIHKSNGSGQIAGGAVITPKESSTHKLLAVIKAEGKVQRRHTEDGTLVRLNGTEGNQCVGARNGNDSSIVEEAVVKHNTEAVDSPRRTQSSRRLHDAEVGLIESWCGNSIDEE